MKLLESVFGKVERHPKRIVFPDGHEPRVLQAAAEYVARKLGVAILLGEKAEIARQAEAHGVSLHRIHLIDPREAEDIPLFLKSLTALPRYKSMAQAEAMRIVTNPNYFASLMIGHGQADGLVGGLTTASGSLLRPLFQIIRPLPGTKSIFGAMLLHVPNSTYGEEGLFCFADCAVIPRPSVEQLALIAIESGRLMRQLTGRPPRIAFLSYSTKGSAQTEEAEKVVAAAALARERSATAGLGFEIDGELQADAALVPEVARVKGLDGAVAGRANVLVFPDLASGNIAAKLVERLARADAYGQILLGLDKPAAEVSRGATVQDILGAAAIVALQAIAYRNLYPDQGAPVPTAD
ncbi:MAG: phosphate acyltransferase [Verrucomicrobium sp.]|nr:phosphate acyltransferase [Verrucomicrobium sp.]